MDVIYYGLFIESGDIKPGTLECPISHPHITFEFKPKEWPTHLIGKTFDIQIVSEGNDGVNEGLGVKLPEELLPYYKGAKIPHITLSVAKGGIPVSTAFIDYAPYDGGTVQATMKLFTSSGPVSEA